MSLAKKNSTGKFSGIHCALLNLVARREEVKKGKDVYWSRPYHVDSEDTKKWISLRELLENEDFDLKSFLE